MGGGGGSTAWRCLRPAGRGGGAKSRWRGGRAARLGAVGLAGLSPWVPERTFQQRLGALVYGVRISPIAGQACLCLCPAFNRRNKVAAWFFKAPTPS